MTADEGPRYTLVSFHAHPDDEALLTGGTLARAAADGHRVVLVVATAGELGLASSALTDGTLGERRRLELLTSARALGVARVEVLGYADSGAAGRDEPGELPEAFSAADVEEVAERLAVILREESADVLTSYDAAGGYGHPDHVHVHRVAARAAELAGTPVLLEATVDRRWIVRAVGLLRLLSRLVRMPELPDMTMAYTAHADLTHCVDVVAFLGAKRAALRAHASQATSDGSQRTLALLLRLPRPIAAVVLGREWFREVGRTSDPPLLDDVFASLRETDALAQYLRHT
jgi:LmbE family N-acetylglucosaminyl deacetylase